MDLYAASMATVRDAHGERLIDARSRELEVHHYEMYMSIGLA